MYYARTTFIEIYMLHFWPAFRCLQNLKASQNTFFVSFQPFFEFKCFFVILRFLIDLPHSIPEDFFLVPKKLSSQRLVLNISQKEAFSLAACSDQNRACWLWSLANFFKNYFSLRYFCLTRIEEVGNYWTSQVWEGEILNFREWVYVK